MFFFISFFNSFISSLSFYNCSLWMSFIWIYFISFRICILSFFSIFLYLCIFLYLFSHTFLFFPHTYIHSCPQLYKNTEKYMYQTEIQIKPYEELNWKLLNCNFHKILKIWKVFMNNIFARFMTKFMYLIWTKNINNVQ